MALLTAAVVGAMAVPLGAAVAAEPGPPTVLESESEQLAGGPDNQTDPHLSGNLVVYTDSGSAHSEIRYVDVAGGPSGAVPNLGHRDSLPDVFGSLVVFRRVFADGSSSARPIMVFDVDAPQLGARELAPEAGARRSSPAIGGSTVAFQQQSGPMSSQSEICVADLADLGAPAVCLTSDGQFNRDPAVSPDGATVTFTRCLNTGLGCDVHVARRGSDGTWGQPVAVTGAPAEDIQPVTDGELVAYASNGTGDFDIRWQRLEGTAPDRLVLSDQPGSTEAFANLSGGVLSFEREMPGDTRADLWLYRLATDELFRLTDTEGDEVLHDLVVGPSGEVLVVYAQADGLALGDNDVHVLRAQLPVADDEAPVLTLPADLTVDATGPDGAAVDFAVDAPGATVTCEPPSGSTFPIGTTAVACTAVDAAGNASSGSFAVTVRGAREQLVDLIDAVAGVGPGTSLAAKIRTAVDRLPDRYLTLACFPLRAFIAAAEAQSGKSVSAEQAAVFVADATRIRAVLACP